MTSLGVSQGRGPAWFQTLSTAAWSSFIRAIPGWGASTRRAPGWGQLWVSAHWASVPMVLVSTCSKMECGIEAVPDPSWSPRCPALAALPCGVRAL